MGEADRDETVSTAVRSRDGRRFVSVETFSQKCWLCISAQRHNHQSSCKTVISADLYL